MSLCAKCSLNIVKFPSIYCKSCLNGICRIKKVGRTMPISASAITVTPFINNASLEVKNG